MGPEVPAAALAIQAYQDSQLEEHELAATRITIDLDAEESTCPACLGTIPKGATRCPECKLRLG